MLFLTICFSLLGPRCVLSCLYDKTIPNLPTPIFTVAMRDKIVCASGIKNSEKVFIKILTFAYTDLILF